MQARKTMLANELSQDGKLTEQVCFSHGSSSSNGRAAAAIAGRSGAYDLECFLSSGSLTPVSDGSVSDITASEESGSVGFEADCESFLQKVPKASAADSSDWNAQKRERDREKLDGRLSLVDLYQSCRIGDMDALSNFDWISKLFASLSRDKSSPFPTSLSPYGDTMFHMVSRHGHLECLKILVKAFPQESLLQADNEAGESILDVAYNTEIYRFVEEMVSRLAWLDKTIRSDDVFGHVLQWIAAQDADRTCEWIQSSPLDVVRRVLKHVKDPLGHSILHYACLFDLPTVLSAFAARLGLKSLSEPLPYMTTPSRNTLLHEAVRFLSFEAVAYLIEKYDWMMTIKNMRSETASDLANKKMRRWMKQTLSTFSQRALAKESLLFSSGSALHHRVADGFAGSIRPSKRKHSTAVLCTDIELADMPKKRGPGRPPKIRSAEHKEVASTRTKQAKSRFSDKWEASESSFVSHLPPLDPKTYDKSSGRSQLHICASRGNLEAVQRLIELGAPVNSQDNAGYTPLHEAALNGHLLIVAALLDHGSDPNIKSTVEGDTALHDASENGHIEVVKLLLSRGSDRSIRNNHGALPNVESLLGLSPVDPVEAKVREEKEHFSCELHEEPSSRNVVAVAVAIVEPQQQEHLLRSVASANKASALTPHEQNRLSKPFPPAVAISSQHPYDELLRWRRRSSSLSEFGLKSEAPSSPTLDGADSLRFAEYPPLAILSGPPKLAAKLRHRRLSTSAG